MVEPYLGEIRMFGGNYAPIGWALCDGRHLQISEYESLFALIGTSYGGDGQVTFALPDLRGRIPIHQGKNQETNTNYIRGSKGGTETVTLTRDQIPAHTHVTMAYSEQGNTNNPKDAVWARSTVGHFSPQQVNGVAPMQGNLLSEAGGSQPHSNLMPYLCVNFIISLDGVYPSQS